MRTLDEAWQQFRDNTKASVVVTTTRRNYQWSKTTAQLAANLGVCEAALRHIDELGSTTHVPDAVVPTLTRAIRATIVEPNPESLRYLKSAIDALFGWSIVLQARMSTSTLLLDAMSSLGWMGKAALFLSAGDVPRANDAGRNAVDAVIRVVILTGHSRDDLVALLTELCG